MQFIVYVCFCWIVLAGVNLANVLSDLVVKSSPLGATPVININVNIGGNYAGINSTVYSATVDSNILSFSLPEQTCTSRHSPNSNRGDRSPTRPHHHHGSHRSPNITTESYRPNSNPSPNKSTPSPQQARLSQTSSNTSPDKRSPAYHQAILSQTSLNQSHTQLHVSASPNVATGQRLGAIPLHRNSVRTQNLS